MLTIAGGIVLGFFAIVIIIAFGDTILKFFAGVLILVLFLAAAISVFTLAYQITSAPSETQLDTKTAPWMRYKNAVVVAAPQDINSSP